MYVSKVCILHILFVIKYTYHKTNAYVGLQIFHKNEKFEKNSRDFFNLLSMLKTSSKSIVTIENNKSVSMFGHLLVK